MNHYPIVLPKSKFSLTKFLAYFDGMQENELNFQSDLIYRKTVIKAVEYATGDVYIPREVTLVKYLITITFIFYLTAVLGVSFGASIISYYGLGCCIVCVLNVLGVLSIGWVVVSLILLYSWRRMV